MLGSKAVHQLTYRCTCPQNSSRTNLYFNEFDKITEHFSGIQYTLFFSIQYSSLSDDYTRLLQECYIIEKNRRLSCSSGSPLGL